MIAGRSVFTAVSLYSLTLFGLIAPAWAQNRGEYGQADVEVDRSVLQSLEGYQPPPMFEAAPSQRVAVPPPERPALTAPQSETLLSHPIENHHVFTVQKSGEATSLTAPAAPLPVPAMSAETKNVGKQVPVIDAPQPIPSRKPQNLASLIKKEDPPKPSSVDVPPAPEKIPPVAEKKADSKAYKPMSPKTMPAVPPVKVESKPLAKMANLPPPIEPEKAEKPSVGEIMMDDALTRHMVKDEKDVKEALGIEGGKNEPKKDSPPSPESDVGDLSQFSLGFASGATDINADHKTLLKQEVVDKISKDTLTRLQIRSYASRTDGSESSARRISLSRALAVRSYLLENGIVPTRIDIRALSDKTGESPADRIDISLIKTH